MHIKKFKKLKTKKLESSQKKSMSKKSAKPVKYLKRARNIILKMSKSTDGGEKLNK